MNPELVLIRAAELTEADLAAHPVWVTYYEFEELELLADLGLDVARLSSALAAVGQPDDYVIPVPAEAANLPFKYVHLSVVATTPGGTVLRGTRTRVSLSLLHRGDWFRFNPGLQDLSLQSAAALAAATGDREIFPLSVFVPASGKTETFTLHG
ncbi:hypothetical protein H1235_04700 [Pseudoxanthomonas sp. NC8]|nr:hypothetical protein H1235_04700 [Pseudoxanthomonas sp. NC8]